MYCLQVRDIHSDFSRLHWQEHKPHFAVVTSIWCRLESSWELLRMRVCAWGGGVTNHTLLWIQFYWAEKASDELFNFEARWWNNAERKERLDRKWARAIRVWSEQRCWKTFQFNHCICDSFDSWVSLTLYPFLHDRLAVWLLFSESSDPSKVVAFRAQTWEHYPQGWTGS